MNQKAGKIIAATITLLIFRMLIMDEQKPADFSGTSHFFNPDVKRGIQEAMTVK